MDNATFLSCILILKISKNVIIFLRADCKTFMYINGVLSKSDQKALYLFGKLNLDYFHPVNISTVNAQAMHRLGN